VHSVHQEFGKTDLGVMGMEYVLANHNCNDICRQLNLQNPMREVSIPGNLSSCIAYALAEQYLTTIPRNRAVYCLVINERIIVVVNLAYDFMRDNNFTEVTNVIFVIAMIVWNDTIINYDFDFAVLGGRRTSYSYELKMEQRRKNEQRRSGYFHRMPAIVE